MASDLSFEAEVERNYRHNFTVNIIDATAFWFGASFIATRTILPVYVANLTDSELAIGLLATIVSTGWMLPQLFTANWVQRCSSAWKPSWPRKSPSSSTRAWKAARW